MALDALADATRRRVFESLRHGERSVRELTEVSTVTQSAISQHLRVLRDAGLVAVRPDGTRRLYRIDLDGLGPVRAWVDSFWDDALAAFADHANQPGGGEPNSGVARAAHSDLPNHSDEESR